MRKHTKNQAGFTIVELMIASTVFSAVLVVIVFGVLRFTSSYYRGVNSSLTQTTARTAMDTITQAIQFGTTTTQTPAGVTNGQFCAGGKVFLYTLGVLNKGNTQPTSGHWGLYEVSDAGGCTYSATTAGTELLGDNMRLANISVTPAASANLWQVSLRIVFGDDDLLSNPTATNANCKFQTGMQFCSAASLTTITQQRITQGP